MNIPALRSHADEQTESALHGRNGIFDFRPAVSIWILVYTTALTIVTLKHEMWRDELQAWLIARDSSGLLSLFHNNRFEGHPLLWQSFLFVLTRFSKNPLEMKLLNLCFALATGCLLLSLRQFRLWVRCGFAFSYFYFFEYGVLARDYMIGVLLLTAASVLLAYFTRHRILTLLLLALSIQTTLFAIPVAGFLFVIYYCRPPQDNGEKTNNLGIELSPFNLVSGAILLGSLAFALFTMRPPVGTGVPLSLVGHFHSYVVGFYNIAFAYLPFPGHASTFWNSDILFHLPHWNFTVLPLSLLIFSLILAGLRTPRARLFFLLSTLALVEVFQLTDRNYMRHIGYLIVIFFLSLFFDAVDRGDRRLSPNRPFRWFIAGILAVQVGASVFACAESITHVFSAGEEAAAYLNSAGLEDNPMLINPDYAGSPLLGYLERPSAFFLHGMRSGSFTIWDKGYMVVRPITRAAMRAASDGSAKPLIVVTTQPLPTMELRDLGLQPLTDFTGTIVPGESLYLYESH